MKIIKRFLLGFAIVAILLLLSVPFITPYVLRSLSAHYLGHRLEVQTYRYSWDRFRLNGTFDDNSTIAIDAAALFSQSRQVTLALQSNVRFFDRLSGMTLPDADFNATLLYRHKNIHGTGTIFGGDLTADIDLRTLEYTYRLDRADIALIQTAQALPVYAQGYTSLSGNGSATEPYAQKVNVLLYDIKAEPPLVTLSGIPSITDAGTINGSIDVTLEKTSLLQAKASLASPLFNFALHNASYDLSNGSFSFALAFFNHQLAKIPFKRLQSRASGTYASPALDANVSVDNEAYALALRNLHYDMDKAALHSGLLLRSYASRPINLTSSNAVKGSVDYRNNTLNADLSTETMKEPLHLVYRGTELKLISNNIPLKTLFSIANQPALLSGHLDLDAAIDTNGSYPGVSLAMASKDIMPDARTSESLGLTRPLSLKAHVKGKKRYRADITLNSEISGKTETKIDYDASAHLAAVNAHMEKLALAGYTTSDISLRTEADLKRQTLKNTTVVSAFEAVSIPELAFPLTEPVSGQYTIRRLDRFYRDANRSAVLRGTFDLKKAPDAVALGLSMSGIGRLDLTTGDHVQALRSKALDLGQLFALLNIPAPLTGDIAVNVHADDENISLDLHSHRLQPSKELNATLRPFPLDASLKLKQRPDSYLGTLKLRSDADTFTAHAMKIDLSRQQIQTRYLLDIGDANRSALRLPPGIFVKRIVLHGGLQAGTEYQSLSLHSDPILFTPAIHRKIDKNASAPLPVIFDVNTTHSSSHIEADASVTTEPLTLSPVRAYYDTNTSKLDLTAFLKTKRFLGDTSLAFQGIVNAEGIRKGELNIAARSEELNVTKLHVDPKHDRISFTALLAADPLHSEQSSHQRYVLKLMFRTQPEVNVRLQSESLDGNLSAVVNDNLLIAHMSDLSLEQLLHFAYEKPPVTGGRLDGNIYLKTSDFRDGNLSRLDGGIDIRLRDAYLKGANVDGYLQTLQDSQDFSLFQGSVMDLPVIRNIKQVAEGGRAKNQTQITQARFAASVTKGEMVCSDCAAATPLHRIAAAGNVNLPAVSFDRFFVALLKPGGCPYFVQEITGKLNDPKINLAASGIRVIGGTVVSIASNVTEATNWLTGVIYKVSSATGDVISYVPIAGKTTDKALKSVSGTLHGSTSRFDECTPFYLGSIPPPKTSGR